MRRSLWRTNLWLVPTLCVLAALGLFVIAQALDRIHHIGWIQLPRWLNQGGAADARDLLSATAGAIITTLGLILSITVLTLSIAATQFGQRMLRRYMRDRGTQVSIGIFAATFVFTLLTLLSVTSRMEEREYVPWLSVWVSVVLAISCIGVLIFFVHHVAETIQVHHVMSDIVSDLRRMVGEATRPAQPPSDPDVPAPRPDYYLKARATGYLRQVHYENLIEVAARDSALIQFLHRPGHFVLEGSPLAAVTCERPGAAFGKTARLLADALHKAVHIGPNRTLRQDPEFAIDQLVEIALRAMSPGINDPFTMFCCVDWLADSLRILASAPPAPHVYADPQGVARVIVVTESFDELVRAAFHPLRGVADSSLGASLRLLGAITALAPHVSAQQTSELHTQAELIREGFNDLGVSHDRAEVELAYQHAVRALSQRDERPATSDEQTRTTVPRGPDPGDQARKRA